MFLPELPVEETGECIRAFFEREGKRVPPEASVALVGAARQYPFYVQRLASEVFERSGQVLSKEDVALAKTAVLQSETGLYETMIAPLTTRQLRLLKILATTPSAHLLSANFVTRAELPDLP